MPGIERVRVVRINSALLRPVEEGDEPYALYLNLFPDLGFRIYVYRGIERDYGYDWLASTEPEYDGRRWVELILNTITGISVTFNSRDLGLDRISFYPIEGTSYLAVMEDDGSVFSYGREGHVLRPRASWFLLSTESNSFVAETSVSVVHSAVDFHFLGESLGYYMISGGADHLYPAKLYKTEDGGTHWSLVSNALPGTPMRVTFLTAAEGDVWSRLSRGCAGPSCPSLFKTLDGGKTWAPIANPGLVWPGALLKARIGGALFGIVGRASTEPGVATAALVNSNDGGQTWSDVFRFTEAPIEFADATVFDDVLYVGFRSGMIYAIDPANGEADTIDVGTPRIRDFDVASENVIVATTFERRVVRSTDRGATWATVLERDDSSRGASLLAAPSADELIVIVNKGLHGPSDTAGTVDVIAYSNDGGTTWEESALVGGLLFAVPGERQSVSGRAHKLLLIDRVLTVWTPQEN
jgi:photosystem II stability/assembly factor-like uncharacterized protein